MLQKALLIVRLWNSNANSQLTPRSSDRGKAIAVAPDETADDRSNITEYCRAVRIAQPP